MLSLHSAEEGDKLYRHLSAAIAPRPIAFVSTLGLDGTANLAPFSFFNVFSATPPVIVFSPVTGEDNTLKHTHSNLLATKECVVNVVSYNMVQQMSLASFGFEESVDEFKKSGFQKQSSDVVNAYRVAGAPVQFECKVKEITSLGSQKGAGNLVICEVIKMHIEEAVLDEEGYINPVKIDLVARMGGDWYSRAKAGLFEVSRPTKAIIGIDAIPAEIKESNILTGNDLGKLGSVSQIPSLKEAKEFVDDDAFLVEIIATQDPEVIHKQAQLLLTENRILEAWKLLIAKY
ncbi:flavin reductase family protein [Zunongwangia sp.]|uniref:flavin reductase family protein n=1 Tax=Zunongwangia sp. TaxID=1965325 RepID=UPI003AA8D50C